jgi:hypothetical protein
MSTLFLTLQVTLIRSVFCMASNARGKTDRLTGILGIMAGNMSIIFESVGRRTELALWMAPKMFESMWNFMVRRGFAKPIPWAEPIILVLAMGILGVGSVERKDYVKRSYNNILKTLWN